MKTEYPRKFPCRGWHKVKKGAIIKNGDWWPHVPREARPKSDCFPEIGAKYMGLYPLYRRIKRKSK